MSMRVTVGQFRNRSAELLDRTVERGEEHITQRDADNIDVAWVAIAD
jgi:antitoxin (DNA-binding transcriptional repressor) of toxin-antitoxin stability system